MVEQTADDSGGEWKIKGNKNNKYVTCFGYIIPRMYFTVQIIFEIDISSLFFFVQFIEVSSINRSETFTAHHKMMVASKSLFTRKQRKN